MGLFEKLKHKIHPPSWLPNNTHYLCIMGSHAYGCNNPDSDMDIYGWCIPPKELVWPHLGGEIPGFGKQLKRFEQYQEQGIHDEEGREYDFSIYSVVRYAHLAIIEANPNLLDSLFVPDDCVLINTRIGQIFRDNRKLCLHKKAWHTYRGYSYAQIKLLKNKNREGKRQEIVAKYGYDVKFAYHLVRLLCQIEQILQEHDLDLRRHNDLYKTIRRGEVSEEYIYDYFTTKENQLEELYHKSDLPYGPDESKIKSLLLQILEEHYGSLDKCIVEADKYKEGLNEIRDILVKYHIV